VSHIFRRPAAENPVEGPARKSQSPPYLNAQ
jgi:hypothetical protein